MVAVARFIAVAAVACLVVPALPFRPALASHDLQPSHVVLAHAGTSSQGLDLDSLEKRLKKTKSIDVFTKLALKIEFNKLIEDFRLHHDGEGDGAMGELIGRFENLLVKTLNLVRKGDPALFRTLTTSRPALRIVLVDPARFAAALNPAKRSFPTRPDR